MMTCDKPTSAKQLEDRIRAHGYTLRYVEYCEDARTPGLLGQIRGVTDHERREVKISTKVNSSNTAMIEILKHELRHLDEPDWDCGNRDVIGRGGKSNVVGPYADTGPTIPGGPCILGTEE